jgi:hypothetical protein
MSIKQTESFKQELNDTYRTIIDIISYSGNSGIANSKRIQTYERAISVVKNARSAQLDKLVEELGINLTKAPCKVMKDIFKDDKVVLDKKEPYNGVTIKNGKILDENKTVKKFSKDLGAFDNLTVLTGLGIGIGNSSVADLVKMGYSSLDQLKIVYQKNKFKDFRKGLQGPLCKYFEGITRVSKMSREEASKWKQTIDNILDNTLKEFGPEKDLIYKIAGSYARKKEEIGDIDYVISTPNNKDLYNFLNLTLDKLSEITKVSDLDIELISVDETPRRPKSGETRYSTNVKIWFNNLTDNKKTKIELYGYAQNIDEFCFVYFARGASVELQKKIKIHASKNGYKLGPWALDKKGTDVPAWEYEPELFKERIGKEKITTIREIYKFLDYPIK